MRKAGIFRSKGSQGSFFEMNDKTVCGRIIYPAARFLVRGSDPGCLGQMRFLCEDSQIIAAWISSTGILHSPSKMTERLPAGCRAGHNDGMQGCGRYGKEYSC